MQNMLNDPDTMRQMMMMNPQTRAMMEANPEFAQLINNPAIMRQGACASQRALRCADLLRAAADMLRNPALMQEMQRNNDRAMANIEAHPEVALSRAAKSCAVVDTLAPRRASTRSAGCIRTCRSRSWRPRVRVTRWLCRLLLALTDNDASEQPPAPAAAAANNPFAALFGQAQAPAAGQQQQQQPAVSVPRVFSRDGDSYTCCPGRPFAQPVGWRRSRRRCSRFVPQPRKRESL